MVFIMDKMKEHSCAIQPAFGGGLNGLNVAFMFDQVIADNIPPAAVEVPIDPPGGFAFINAPPQPINISPVANTFVQNILSGEPGFQGGIPTIQSVMSIAEIVANAVEQHLANNLAMTETSESTQNTNGTNNVQSQTIDVAELIQNAIQEQLNAPAAAPLPTNNTTSYVMLNNAAFQFAPSWPSSPTQGNGISPGLNQHFPFSEMQNLTSPVPQDEESNSNPPLNAPVSSSYVFSASQFNPSDDEGYGPSLESNFVIIVSPENSDNANENQINNPDVPNESS